VVSDEGVSGIATKLCEEEQGKRLFDMLRARDTLVDRWVDRLGRNYTDGDPIRAFMRRRVIIKTVINGFQIVTLSRVLVGASLPLFDCPARWCQRIHQPLAIKSVIRKWASTPQSHFGSSRQTISKWRSKPQETRGDRTEAEGD
jgi:hypothetical protein